MATDWFLPVKIECRSCFGDGIFRHGYSKPMKITCRSCDGRKHMWVHPTDVKDSDVVLKR